MSAKSIRTHALRLLNVFCRTYSIRSAFPFFFDPDGSLGLSVLQDYIKLRADTQAKNIAAWTPVVAEILDGFCRFDTKAVCDCPRRHFFFTDLDMQFVRYLPAVYPLATELLARDVAPEIRVGLKMYFERVGLAQGIVEAS